MSSPWSLLQQRHMFRWIKEIDVIRYGTPLSCCVQRCETKPSQVHKSQSIEIKMIHCIAGLRPDLRLCHPVTRSHSQPKLLQILPVLRWKLCFAQKFKFNQYHLGCFQYLLRSRATGKKRRHAEFIRDVMLTRQSVLRPPRVWGVLRNSQVLFCLIYLFYFFCKSEFTVPLLSSVLASVSPLSLVLHCTPV